MKASNRTRKIKQKENTSDLTLGIGQCKSSCLSTLFSFSHVFGSNTFHHVPCDLKQCSIRVNVMAWCTVSTAGKNGSSKHYHVMGTATRKLKQLSIKS